MGLGNEENLHQEIHDKKHRTTYFQPGNNVVKTMGKKNAPDSYG